MVGGLFGIKNICMLITGEDQSHMRFFLKQMGFLKTFITEQKALMLSFLTNVLQLLSEN